jgi:hypothetical protein
LRGGSSLIKLLAKHRGARNAHALPQLTTRQILVWADAHCAAAGQWPNEYSGAVRGAPGEKWWNISAALRDGGRGLPGGSSLPKLLARYRSVRNRGSLARLTIRQILVWADAYRHRTGQWPTALSGNVASTVGESWRGVDNALKRGARGLRKSTSLARLLSERRGYAHVRSLSPLNVAQIGHWARAYHAKHGRWPTAASGVIPGTMETWSRISGALRRGYRGLPSGGSLKRFCQRLGV